MQARAIVAVPLIVFLIAPPPALAWMSGQAPVVRVDPQTETQTGAQTQSAVMPTDQQLRTFLAPIALYPDQLLAQICTAAEDPQQVLNVDQWLKQQGSLQGQSLTDAAQQQNFDPAFIALVNFPQVLGQMAEHISDYAAIGYAYKANQKQVQDAIQLLRSEAYASGALRTNQQQSVNVSTQNGQQVIVIQPANPEVVYVPEYNPEVVYVESGPSTGDVVAASLITFGAGIALGAWIGSSYPWGWGGWAWHWGYPPPPFHPPPPHWGPPGPGPGPHPGPGPGPHPGPGPQPGPGPHPGPQPGPRPGQGGGGTQFQPTRPGANGGGIQRPYSGYTPPSNMGGFHPGNGSATRMQQQRGNRSFHGFGGGGRRFGGRR
jgi:hypothetical protein